MSGKPEPPLDIEIERVGEAGHSIQSPISVAITIRPRTRAQHISVTLETSGVARLTVPRREPFEWHDVAPLTDLIVSVDVACSREGEGSLRVIGRLAPEQGILETRIAQLDLLAISDQVLAGRAGFLALNLEHLDRLLATGRISPTDYERRRAAVLGGGAIESNGR